MDIIGKRILVIVAHPDDESYLASGTCYLNAQAGGSTYLICATYGEQGRAHITGPISAGRLKQIRRKELERAAKYLHIKKIFLLNLPDKHVRASRKEAFERILRIARRLRPEVIIGFGPDGFSGHTDHIAMGAVSQKIARRLRLPHLAFCLAPAVAARSWSWLLKRRKHGSYQARITFGRANLKIPIPPRVKWKALSCHKSQHPGGVPFAQIPKYAAEAHMKAEYYHISA